MTEVACLVCGESNDARARFCSACGVDLAAPVVAAPGADTREDAPAEPRRAGLAMLIVPLAVVLVLGLGVLFLTSGGDDDSDPDPEAAFVPGPTPTPAPTPTATPFRVTLPERTPLQPTPTRTPAGPQALDVEPADLSVLPPTDATHLAVAHDRDLAYLDLTTGAWSLHERVNLSSVPRSAVMQPFERGVVTNDAESVLYVPVGERPRVLVQGTLLGIRDGLVYVQSFSSDGRDPIRGFDANGTMVDEIDLPEQAYTPAMLPSGELVVESGGRVFLVGASETTVLSVGRLLGVSESKVLLYVCDVDLLCTYELFDSAAETGFEIEQLRGTEGFPQLVRDDRILLYRFSRDDVELYRIEEDAVVLESVLTVQDASLIAAGFGEAVATDTTGLYARVEGDRLLFHGPTGDPITEVPLDFLQGFGDSYALAFVTIDG